MPMNLRVMRYMFFGVFILAVSGVPAAATTCHRCVDYEPLAIVLPAAKADDAGLRFAADELVRAMGELYTATPTIAVDTDFSFHSDRRGIVIVGRDNALIQKLGLQDLLSRREDIHWEGYSIRAGTLPGGTNPVIVIHGNEKPGDATPSPRGCIYGLAYLVERLMLNPRAVFDIDLVREPAFRIRMMSGDSPENALRYGYNTVFAPMPPARAALLEDYDPQFFYQFEKQSYRVMDRRKIFADTLDLQDAFHLETVTASDGIEFHRALVKRPHDADMLTAADPPQVCACASATWTFNNAVYSEMFRDFPGVDYALLDTVPGSPAEDYLSGAPVYREDWLNCPACAGQGYNELMAGIMNREWNAVVGQGKRMYIHRVNDAYTDGFHAGPDTYLKILNLLEKRDKMFVSLKYTKTDFRRYNFPNENIGLGDVPQIIEYPCRRGYEGGGAFPNFTGEELGEAYLYALDNHAAGAWNRHNEAEGSGLEIRTGLWLDANIYAAAHLAWDPHLSAGTLAREWAQLHYGLENAGAMARLLLISDDAALKLFYFRAYEDAAPGPHAPEDDWLSQDRILDGRALRRIYDRVPDRVPDMVAEKDDGVRLAEQMLLLASGLVLPDSEKTPIVNTIKYEIYLARVLRSYSSAYFYFCRWKDTGATADRKMAEMYVTRWKFDWNTYKTDTPAMSNTASLYMDGGMEATMSAIIEELPRTPE